MTGRKKKLVSLFNLAATLALVGSISAAQESPMATLGNGIDYAALMTKNNVFLRMCSDVDIDQNGDFYFLDARYGMVIRVHGNSGKLLNTISSKGQGPNELDWPTSLRVKGGNVFIYDRGFGGVKIFDTSGKKISVFKIDNPGQGTSIDVNSRNEIYVQSIDNRAGTPLSVYNLRGTRLRNMIPLEAKAIQNKESYIVNAYIKFRLDSDENLLVLYPVISKKLKKYDRHGVLLWERTISNKILDGFELRDGLEASKGSTVHFSTTIFNLDITPKNNIIVGHIGGGVLYDKNGRVISLLTIKPEARNLDLFRTHGNRLLSVLLFGEIIDVYKFIEGGNE